MRVKLTLAVTCFLAMICPLSAGTPVFKILTAEPGMVRVNFAELVEKGHSGGPIPTGEIDLTQAGESVPIWIEDGGDGSFGTGDHFVFRAEILRGTHGYYHEHSNYNVYLLETNAANPRRMVSPEADGGASSPVAFRAQRHDEVDTLFMRFSNPRNQPQEVWYWQKLACTDKTPFTHEFEVDNAADDPSGTVEITIDVRGWSMVSRKYRDTPDHVLKVFLNDQLIGEETWNGKDSHRFQIQSLPVSQLKNGANSLALKIPLRRGDDGELLIDVTLLNWIEIDYLRNALPADDRQDRFFLASIEGDAGRIHFQEVPCGLTAFGGRGSRMVLTEASGCENGQGELHFRPQAGETLFYTVPGDGFLRPESVIAVTPNDLTDTDVQADYIVIYHPRLRGPLLPLKQAHEARGLRVKMVDVHDIYNAFNHGIIDPHAIRAFLGHAYHRWAKPAPRFVLLVGDASWDTKNSRVIDQNYPDRPMLIGKRTWFNKIPSTPYEGELVNSRNLIPTLHFFNANGHSASDNAFVCVDGDDYYPDMAIGRFPVTTEEEVTAIVDKTVDYLQHRELGPWRRNSLWITNESTGFQLQTDRLAEKAVERGFVTDKVYPLSKENSNQINTQRILDAFDHGQYLVNFYGHGGRFIWRTGPPDPKKNHDLFTLEDLDNLKPNAKLPIILSFTCFSAPFDHPGADSIGEKFLRLTGRGAIGFIGASWRNSPNMAIQRPFLDEFSGEGTVGEAMVKAKREIRNQNVVETYNLMGDPAVPLVRPRDCVALTVQAREGESAYDIRGELSCMDEGEAVLDWLDEGGVKVSSQRLNFTGGKFETKSAGPVPDRAQRVRCYAWHAEHGQEAMGSAAIPKPATENEEPVKEKTGD